MEKILKIFFIFVLIIGVIIPSFFYFLQDRILFHKQPLPNRRLSYLRDNYPGAEEVKITTPDGVELHGWFVKSGVGKAPLLIYFGGNAERICGFIETSHIIEGCSLLLINYRGYGLSQGKPGEEELFRDAVHIYDHFSQRNDVDINRIVAMGRSLGSGVAVHLASKRPLQGVILVTPYDSIENVARETFPFLPVSLLLKHPFDSLSLTPDIYIPALVLTAGEDRVISAQRSQNLIDTWGGPVVHQVIEGEGHNTLQERSVFWESILGFLEDISP